MDVHPLCIRYFLSVFLLVKTVVALVRLRSNLTLYEQPRSGPRRARGRPV